jgi:hypothetical protein
MFANFTQLQHIKAEEFQRAVSMMVGRLMPTQLTI